MDQTEEVAAQCPDYYGQKCELCETNYIMFKCMDCVELMCETCQKIHLKSKASKNHKMVSLISPEMYKINHIRKCPRHIEEDLLMYCNTCNCLICKDCVKSCVHPNHHIEKVDEVIHTKQQELSNIIRQTNKQFEEYKDFLKKITRNKLQFSKNIAKTVKEIKARNKQLKIRLDKIESEYIKQLKNKDKENTEAKEKLEQRLKIKMFGLNQLIQECESKQRHRNIEMVQFVTDVMKRVDRYTLSEQLADVSPPNFKTRDIYDQKLKDLFGYLDINQVTQPLQMNRNVSSAILAIDVEIISSFTSEKNHVVTVGNDQAWLWKYGERGISLVTSDGQVMQNINSDCNVHDVAVSTSGDLFVTVSGGNEIKEITRDNRIKDIYTAQDNYVTRGITVTDTGNVLVVLYKYKDSKIVEITTSGQHIRTIQHDPVDNKQLFNHPRFICTNINSDIIVTDDDKVVVVNEPGQKRFLYQPEGRHFIHSFSPQYTVTDKHGHIIISDYWNSLIHVLDRDGKFIKYLMTPEYWCERPYGMDLDNHGRLWLCNYGKQEIKIIKYL